MRTAGVALILLAFAALWLYNTGRLEAILGVIHDPNFQPAKTQFVAGLGTVPTGASSGVGDLFGAGGLSTPPIAGTGDALGSIGQIFGGILPFLGL